MSDILKLKARIYLLTAEEGGRSTSVISGIRWDAQDKFGSWWGAPTTFTNGVGEPGNEYDVEIQMVSLADGRFNAGDGIELREGNRVVAKGLIL
jgi:translation elongation factor EF-Tu-like GTPase